MRKFLILALGTLAVCLGTAQAAGRAKPPRSQSVSPPAEVVALSEDQLAVAQRVLLGHMPCELGAQVRVSADPALNGRFLLELGRQKFVMLPVPTSTGAVRLEDAAAGAVWLQLANKSMLMDQRHGHRLADECMGADQALVAQRLMQSPGPSLLDVPPVSAPPAAVLEASVNH